MGTTGDGAGAAEGQRAADREATELPVARILPMVQPAHLDRAFDYLVPPHLAEAASAGVRVRVRFAGRVIDGFVLERCADSDHRGDLGSVDKVISPLPVLTDELTRLSAEVAERYAGTRAEVLRLAVPPRHARAERAALDSLGLPPGGRGDSPAAPAPEAVRPSAEGWSVYTYGAGFLDAVARGAAPRAVWQAIPGEDWARRIAETAAATLAGGRSAVVIVPDRRDLNRVAAAVRALGLSGAAVDLAAGLGPQARYRRWVTALAGPPCIVLGNRSAVFAPAARLGTVIVWDDGDDLLAEPRAPYPHSRDVALMRADAAGAGFLLGGYARTAEAQWLVEHGWAKDLLAPRGAVRCRSPLIRALADSEQALARDPAARRARLPAIGFAAAREALAADAPVLVQVPRAGYLPSVGCAKCREPARCRRCAGPLELPRPGRRGAHTTAMPDAQAPAYPTCRWCGTAAASHRCARCGSKALRARVTGAERTAEEFGRAFRGVPVIASSGADVREYVPPRAAVVVATVGAEPVAEGGYGAALLLDGWALLTRADLRAGEETLRRWMAAAALVRSREAGGRVVVVAESGVQAVQSLIRWDPVGHARAELVGRREVRFPPAVRLVAVDGEPGPLAAFIDLLDGLDPPDRVDRLGPVPLPSGVRMPGAEEGTDPGSSDAQRMLLRVARRDGPALSRSLALARAAFSSRRRAGQVRVQVDPMRVG